MKKFLVTGPDIDKLHQEERIRMERGDIKFYPLPEDFDIEAFLASLDEEAEDPGEDLGKNPGEEDPEGGEKPEDPEEVTPEGETPGESPVTDEKTPEVEDIKEMNLDEDTKDTPTEDTKDVPAADAKDETTTPKTSKRTKKSE